MIALVLLIAGCYLLAVLVGRRWNRRDQRQAELATREQDRARAHVLLHRTHRQRQLDGLEREMEGRTEERLWHWGRGDWGDW